MSRLARIGAGALLAVAVALAGPAAIRPADAAPHQTPPLIPIEDLIPVLEPLQPVLEVVSPIAWPQCANAVLVNVLPGALGIDVPPELATVTGPLLVVCGSVPVPGTNQRVCALDVEAQNLLAELTKPLLGAGLPVEVAPSKWLSGLLDNIVDQIPVPGVPIGSTVAATLQCVDPPAAPTTTTTTLPEVAGETTTTVAALPELSFVDPPTFAELQTLPPVTPELAAPPAAPIEAPQVLLIDQPRFRYPAVMGLPLAFLALLALFGRALTRPLDGRADGAPPAAPSG